MITGDYAIEYYSSFCAKYTLIENVFVRRQEDEER